MLRRHQQEGHGPEEHVHQEAGDQKQPLEDDDSIRDTDEDHDEPAGRKEQPLEDDDIINRDTDEDHETRMKTMMSLQEEKSNLWKMMIASTETQMKTMMSLQEEKSNLWKMMIASTETRQGQKNMDFEKLLRVKKCGHWRKSGQNLWCCKSTIWWTRPQARELPINPLMQGSPSWSGHPGNVEA